MRLTPSTGAAAKLASLLAATMIVLVAVPMPAASAAPPAKEGRQSSLGNDVSWPQCGKTLPTDPAFAIVGVNNGLANTTNPCFTAQLTWAKNSTTSAAPSQPDVALYVNTANPELSGSWWPVSNIYPDPDNKDGSNYENQAGTTVHNPYGDCKEALDPVGTACAYMYGYAKAYDDAHIRGVNNPAGYFWWLDVELENSWSTTNRNANRAVLEGMAQLFLDMDAQGVGIYSTNYQWGQIMGTVDSSSNLHALPSWLAGARTVTGAKANCSDSPLTGGGKVVLTQFVSKTLDYNYSCI